MNSFLEEFQKAEKAGKTEQLTREIYTWEEEGQELAGVLENVSVFEGGLYEQEVNQYQINTGEGVVSTILGSATDKQIEKLAKVGMKIYIQYRGKKEIAGSKHVNIFTVKVW